MELHGFCDASKRAYAACVYLRTPNSDVTFQSNLIVAKSKVTPVKTQTIPSLELCGALLLTRLIKQIQNDMTLSEVAVFNWTDSEVVLAWLQGHASRWPTFVAHRVAEIQDAYPARCWNYVTSGNNPTDKATRGLTSDELTSDKFWWDGPPWLSLNQQQWPKPKSKQEPSTLCLMINESDEPQDLYGTPRPTKQRAAPAEELMAKFSSLSKLLRVVVYIFRFSDRKNRQTGFLEQPSWTKPFCAWCAWRNLFAFQAKSERCSINSRCQGHLRRCA